MINAMRHHACKLVLPILAASLLLDTDFALGEQPVGSDKKVDYLRQIKPILARHCFACHGALKQESGLRLDTGSLIRKGGDGGPAITLGNAAKSLLIQRVTATDESERMPAEGKPLSAQEIALLRMWINQGAQSPADEKPQEDPRKHWAFQMPKRPPLAQVKRNSWVRNPIDNFIAASHEKHGLTSNPAAAKHVLLRRVFLDLVGLPPTREELHAFLADDSDGAYKKVVDRLLDSPHYGERWGRHWMDVWRYSDWYGRRAVNDVRNSYPHVWRWRDWIVKSLNDDKGYDRMILEMLAADEIAPTDDDAIVATGFIVRNWFSLNYDQWMKDMVEHTGKAFLGIRMNCAHCHDHKYDPITQEEYFRFRAFFEPLEFRHDRVPGGPALTKYKRYTPGSGASLKPIQAGLARIFDENLDAKTHMYKLGDARDRFDRPPVSPGAPAILGGDKLKIEAFDLPAEAWYPGLKPWLQQQEIAKRVAAVKSAEAVLAKSKQQVSPDVAPLQAKVKQAEQELRKVEKELAETSKSANKGKKPQALDPGPSTLDQPIGYWRFEGADNDRGFLADSNGGGHVLLRVTGKDPQAAVFALNASGMGRHFFNPIPVSNTINKQAAQFTQRSSVGYLATKGRTKLYANSFTIEAYLYIAVAKTNFNCGIVDNPGSWMLLHRGLNSSTSEFRLRYFNAKGDVRDISTGTGQTKLTLATGHDYYIAVTMSDRHVTFYAKNLTTNGPLQLVQFDRSGDGTDFATLAKVDEKQLFKIGNSGNGTGRHQGLLDEVRYLRVALSKLQIAARTKTSPAQLRLADAKRKVETARAKLNAASLSARLHEGELANAKAQLQAIKSRIAADNAKHNGTGGNVDELSKAASKAERIAAVHAAKASLLKAEKALADAQAKAATDAKAQSAVSSAQQQLTKAKSAVATANKNVNTVNANYTPLSPSYPNKSTGRRKALARWIANRKNPLTARVAVNHIWMRHFGRPLVESVFDFGRGGKSPTHPKLLDWLAVELMESAWSMKHVHRLIVTSNTYQMSSSTAGQQDPNRAIDRDNRYWWRFERRRMEAEIIRDSTLHAAGQLELTLGGRDLDPKTSATSRRRSMYFSIYPEEGGGMKFTNLFDAPDPCDCYRRTESIVPQQALAMANSTLALHQGRLVARKVWGEIASGQTDQSKREADFIVAAFEQILSRGPTHREQQVCQSFLQKQVELFRKTDPKQLKGQTTKGVTAPSTDLQMRARESLIRALFNHNDFVTIQ